MIFFDGVRDKGDAKLVIRARPRPAGVVTAELNRLIDLGIGKRFVLSFIPANPSEDSQIFGQLLLCVQTEAILHRAKCFMLLDVRARAFASKEGFVGVAIK